MRHFVNFKPYYQHPHYDARFDKGVTVVVHAKTPRAAIAEAKRQGVHKMGDYPGTKASEFDWFAAT